MSDDGDPGVPLPTISASMAIIRPDDVWAWDRINRARAAGIPDDGLFWLDSVQVDSRKTFEWRSRWSIDDRRLSVTGRGASEPEAFEAFLAALG